MPTLDPKVTALEVEFAPRPTTNVPTIATKEIVSLDKEEGDHESIAKNKAASENPYSLEGDTPSLVEAPSKSKFDSSATLTNVSPKNLKRAYKAAAEVNAEDAIPHPRSSQVKDA